MTKMTLAPEEFGRLETAIKDNPVLDNAFRLMADADLLIWNERHASAPALAVVSMEEISKHFLSMWSKDDPAFTTGTSCIE